MGRPESHCVEKRGLLSAIAFDLLHLPTSHALLILTWIVDSAQNNDTEAYRDALIRGLELLDEVTVFTVLSHLMGGSQQYRSARVSRGGLRLIGCINHSLDG